MIVLTKYHQCCHGTPDLCVHSQMCLVFPPNHSAPDVALVVAFLFFLISLKKKLFAKLSCTLDCFCVLFHHHRFTSFVVIVHTGVSHYYFAKGSNREPILNSLPQSVTHQENYISNCRTSSALYIDYSDFIFINNGPGRTWCSVLSGGLSVILSVLLTKLLAKTSLSCLMFFLKL